MVGLLRVALIKQTFWNWNILTSAKQKSNVHTDLEEQNNPYQMAQRLMHVRINCWRHKAVLSSTSVNMQKNAKWLQNASTVLCSTDKRFLTKYRLAFHKKMLFFSERKAFLVLYHVQWHFGWEKDPYLWPTWYILCYSEIIFVFFVKYIERSEEIFVFCVLY